MERFYVVNMRISILTSIIKWRLWVLPVEEITIAWDYHTNVSRIIMVVWTKKRGGSNPKTLRFYAAADCSKKKPRWKISPISGSLTLSNGFKILRCRRRWSLSFPHWLDLIPTWLVVSTPLKNLSSSVGMMKFPSEWKVIKFHGSIIDYYIIISHYIPLKTPLYPIKIPWFQTTNQQPTPPEQCQQPQQGPQHDPRSSDDHHGGAVSDGGGLN